MNLHKLLKVTNVNNLYKRFGELYNLSITEEIYKEIYNKLKTMDVEYSEEYVIDIEFVKEDTEEYYEISAKKSDEEQKYSLEFETWDKWISYKISDNTLDSYPREDIYNHFIWEMTYHGTNEELIQARKKELEDRIANIDKEKTYTMEEVFSGFNL